MEPSGGWYNTRRQYRSVAFGTWKVGGARQMSQKKLDDVSDFDLIDTVILRKKLIHSGLDRNSRKMGESSPNLRRIHTTETQRSLGALPSSLSTGLRNDMSKLQDCYSSNEYVEFLDRRSRESYGDTPNGNTVSEPIQAIFRADRNLNYSVSTKRKSRLETSVQRVHQRSHSAGADAQHCVVGSASTSEMRNPLAIGRDVANSNTKFLRATKKFFRKIYDSATLPNKKQQAQEGQLKLAVNDKNRSRAMSELTDDDEEDDRTSRIEDYRNLQTKNLLDTTDSGLEMDRSSTPDQSCESMTTAKSDTSSEYRSGEPVEWNHLFEHLRREMSEMRVRDAHILAELHRVESQIQDVKRAQSSWDSLAQVPSLPL